jgi:hypothetical protein
MTLDDMIQQFRAGRLLVVGGERAGDVLMEGLVKLDGLDMESFVAEAFNQGVFDSATGTWDKAMERLKQELGQITMHENK